MESPFLMHRSMVLGHYSTASWLRTLVMAMWNGTDHKAGLSQLATVDDRHFAACSEMIAHYRKHGESDPAFMALAQDIVQRMKEESDAVARSDAFDAWRKDVRHALIDTHKVRPSRASYALEDHYDWLEQQFDARVKAEDAASVLLRDHREYAQEEQPQ